MNHAKPSVVSLFSGVGGLDAAVAAVTGGCIIAHVEHDPSAAKVLAHHWPDVPNLGDATQVDWTPWAGHVDVLCAGFSCQDISGAGLRAGITEESRSGVTWGATARAIRALRPRQLYLENVRDLLVRGLDVVLADLAALGYVGSWTCLRASDIGACHRRDRWFAIAYPDGSGPQAAWSPREGRESHLAARGGGAVAHPAGSGLEWSSHAGRGPQPRAAVARSGAEAAADSNCGQRAEPDRKTIRPTIESPRRADAEGLGQAASDPGRGSEQRRRRPGHLAGTSVGTRGAAWEQRDGDAAGDRRAATADADCAAGGRVEQGSRPGTLSRAEIPERPAVESRRRDSGGRPAGPVAWGQFTPAIARWESITGVAAPLPTVLAPGYVAMRKRRLERRDSRPVGMRGSLRPQRVLSADFVEWMVGLEIGYTDVGISRSARLRCLGNIAMPQQAYAAYRQLLGTMAVAA